MIFLQAQSITTLDELKAALQSAIALEHATIPPYLTARLTLSGSGPGPTYARKSLRQILVQEMRHLQLAANVLNAIGGAPVMKGPSFIPTYPGPLPMGIGHGAGPGGLDVGLVRYSRATVHDVFMKIEEPETPIVIPAAGAALFAFAPTYQTIGEFYAAISVEIGRQGDAIFTGGLGRQVLDGGVPAVTNVASAQAAIAQIVKQGEGTPASPFDAAAELAHYYRFEELARGMQIVSTPAGPVADPSKPIQIDDQADVVQMVDNPRQVDFSSAPRAARLVDECDAIYSKLLTVLHAAFNGQPAKIDDAIAVMFELENSAEELLQQPLAGTHAGFYAGPRFAWVDV
jgi:hypothetical protein